MLEFGQNYRNGWGSEWVEKAGGQLLREVLSFYFIMKNMELWKVFKERGDRYIQICNLERFFLEQEEFGLEWGRDWKSRGRYWYYVIIKRYFGIMDRDFGIFIWVIVESGLN